MNACSSKTAVATHRLGGLAVLGVLLALGGCDTSLDGPPRDWDGHGGSELTDLFGTAGRGAESTRDVSDGLPGSSDAGPTPASNRSDATDPLPSSSGPPSTPEPMPSNERSDSTSPSGSGTTSPPGTPPLSSEPPASSEPSASSVSGAAPATDDRSQPSDPAQPTCARNGDCGDGATCLSGVCVCEDPARTLCGDRCVDTDHDSQHCGICDNDCGAFTACAAGVCESDFCANANPCNGCTPLDGQPGDACGEICGTLVCDGRDALRCEESGLNACGGCGELGGTRGGACGPCGDGELRCTPGNDALVCERATTDCGWQTVSAGDRHACALTDGGTLWCWGEGMHGRLGNGTPTEFSWPVQVRAAEHAPGEYWSDWITVSAGDAHTCGVREDGTLWCWGRGNAGLLGNGDTASSLWPVQVRAAEDGEESHWSDWLSVSAGRLHTCGLREDGSLWCWGEGDRGALGNGATRLINRFPQPVLSTAGGEPWSDWVSVSVGVNHTCGIRRNGTLWCWGSNASGQLGTTADPSTEPTTTPAPVLPAAGVTGGPWRDWDTVVAASGHTCGLRENGTLWCWGLGTEGRLGNGSLPNASFPLPVQVRATSASGEVEDGDEGGSEWATVDAYNAHTCGKLRDGRLWCWGRGSLGRLGSGSGNTDDSARPLQVRDGSGDEAWNDWDMVSTGGAFTCGQRLDASLWCWGYGIHGQLGSGPAGPVNPLPRAVFSPGEAPDND